VKKEMILITLKPNSGKASDVHQKKIAAPLEGSAKSL
jgi:hypothetical protein